MRFAVPTACIEVDTVLGPDRPHDGRTRGSTTSLAVSPSDTDGVESDGPSSGSVDGHAVVRKVARHFLPLVGLCYIVLYLDRLNIGFAALTMNDELGISATMFGFVAGVYFWSYTLCEPVSNWVLSRVGARIWISRIMATWGLVTIGTALVQGATSLAVMRFLLGVAEAGFSPGMLYFVSCWFPHARRGMAMSWVVTFICLSGLGTPMMTHMHGLDGFWGCPAGAGFSFSPGSPRFCSRWPVIGGCGTHPLRLIFFPRPSVCGSPGRWRKRPAVSTATRSIRSVPDWPNHGCSCWWRCSSV